MKFTKNALLATCFLLSPWKTMRADVGIGAVALVAAGVASTIYAIPKLLSAYHTSAMEKARSFVRERADFLDKQATFASDKQLSGSERDLVLARLAKRKEEVRTMWKTHWSRGLTLSGTISYSGRLNIARAMAFNLEMAGNGIVDQCIASDAATLSGDFIITACQFKGKLTLTNASTVVSCDNCLIGDVLIDVPVGSEAPIVECANTIIKGDVISHVPCILVLDKNSIIGGRMHNVTVVYRDSAAS